MKVKTSIRAGGISHNHARKLLKITRSPTTPTVANRVKRDAASGLKRLKVRAKVKAAGLAVTNHARKLLTPAVKAMVDRENDELATAALAQLLPARNYNALPVAILNSQGAEVARQDFVPLIRCANRTKAGEPCRACHYCRVSSDGPEYWAR